MKRIFVTEEQFRKYILKEDINDEGWRRDLTTNKIYWTGKDDDKYRATREYRWIKINGAPEYWGHKQKVEEYPSLNSVSSPRPNQIVKINRGRDGGKYFKYTNKNEELIMVPINNPTKKERQIGLQNIFKSQTTALSKPEEGKIIFIDNNSKRGFYRFERPSNGDTYAVGADTKILNYDDNGKAQWNVKVKKLEKTGINSYHFIGLPTFDLTKSMKHGKIKSGKHSSKDVINVSFDRESIIQFAEYMRKYVWHFLKSYNGNGFLPIDIIVTPETSGKLNTILVSQLKKLIPNAKVMSGLFEKDIENMELDRGIMNDKGSKYARSRYIKRTLTPQQERALEAGIINATEHYLNEFEKDRQIAIAKNIVKKIEKLQNIGADIHEIEKMENEIKTMLLQYYKRVNYSPLYNKGKLKPSSEIKGVQIKNLHQVARYALKNFFKLTNTYDKSISYTDKKGNTHNITIPIQKQLINKRILVVDDNFSSGGTLDNICELLLKNGVNKNDIIPITLGITKESYASGVDYYDVRDI